MQSTKSPLLGALLKVNLACGVVSGVALILMMIVGALDVIGTNIDLIGLSSRPIPAAFEFMTMMMVVSVFMAISLGQARRTHIRVELLVDKFPRPLRMVTDVLRHALSAGFFAAIAYFGLLSAMRAYGNGEYAPGILNFPIWPSRFFLAFGAALMTVQCLFDLIGVFNKRFTVEDTDLARADAPPVS